MWSSKPSDMFLVRTSAMNELDRDVAPSGELLRFQKALRKKEHAQRLSWLLPARAVCTG